MRRKIPGLKKKLFGITIAHENKIKEIRQRTGIKGDSEVIRKMIELLDPNTITK